MWFFPLFSDGGENEDGGENGENADANDQNRKGAFERDSSSFVEASSASARASEAALVRRRSVGRDASVSR